MGADLGAFLDDADADFALGRGGELLQTDRRGEAGGPGPDHDHVVLHPLALDRVAHCIASIAPLGPIARTIKDHHENGRAARDLLDDLIGPGKERLRHGPSALAAFRLMTSSKVVGCCTGRSAGLSP